MLAATNRLTKTLRTSLFLKLHALDLRHLHHVLVAAAGEIQY